MALDVGFSKEPEPAPEPEPVPDPVVSQPQATEQHAEPKPKVSTDVVVVDCCVENAGRVLTLSLLVCEGSTCESFEECKSEAKHARWVLFDSTGNNELVPHA